LKPGDKHGFLKPWKRLAVLKEGCMNNKEAKESIRNMASYLEQNLDNTNLIKENGSKGYRFISQFFNDFKAGKDEIRVLASEISEKIEYHFGPTTKAEMEAMAHLFGYEVQFIPIKREEIPVINLKGSRQYFSEAIFRKKELTKLRK